MHEQITLGGGCYWCLEAIFQRLKGVSSVLSGYSGGTIPNPTAERVYQGDTGHAEVVQVTFDPKVITYQKLLEIFFTFHDPTTLNRQGYDVGDEYRSVIFYHTAEQQEVARDVINGFAKELWHDPILTQLEPLKTFYPATEDMQGFYNSHPSYGYCQLIIDPKVQKLRQEYATLLKN